MTLLRILDYPDPRLKTVAPSVENIHDPRIQTMIADMVETLQNTEHCGGLAATQLDIQNPARIFVYYDFQENESSPTQTLRVIVNPVIVKTEGEVTEEEGCMSVYSAPVKITRPKRTTIDALDQQGNSLCLTREGYLAKLYVHEIDHLNGIINIDHLKPLKRALVDEKIKKALKKRDRIQ
jgi:peptide deformylase